MLLYAAYGSNINIEHMAVLCPEARIYDIGFIKDHTLEFRGSKSNAHATIIRQDGKCVPAVLWVISERCEHALERFEDYPRYYHKEYLEIFALNGRYEDVLTFVMNNNYRDYGTPDNKYFDLIVKGYKEHCFDTDYLNERLASSKKLSECS